MALRNHNAISADQKGAAPGRKAHGATSGAWARRLSAAFAAAFAAAFVLAASAALPTYASFATSGAADTSAQQRKAQDDLAAINKEKQQAKSEYDAAVARLGELDTKIRSLNEQIAEQQASIDQMAQDIAAQEAQIAEYDRQIEEKKAEIAQLELEIGDQNSDLNQRLRVMYETGDESMLAVLLGSENIVDFLANIDMIQAIHRSDQDLLRQLEEKLDAVQLAKDELVRIEGMLVAEKQEMEAQKAGMEAKKASLETSKSDLKSAEAEVKKIKDAALEDIERLEAESKRIQAELASYTSKWGDYGGGAMAWPCIGTITSEYGMRVNPVTGRYVLHAGIDIGVSTGTPIHAAADGVVISAGWNGGYGNLVKIDNGKDAQGRTIVTCYAHNSGFAVGAGQNVTRGQVIAYAGSTGNSTGPHCHFEVRVNGEPQNPRGWL